MPILTQSETALINAFTFLSNGRTHELGFGVTRPNPITISEMLAYKRVFAMPYELSIFVGAIREFDMDYIKDEIDRINRDAKKKPHQPPKRGK